MKSGTTPTLEFAILGLLKEQDLHGYELRRRLSELLGPIGRLSFGTLYPALSRLESNGAVAVLKVSESRTGLTTQRGRKVYGITADGHALFENLLSAGPVSDDDKTFALRLAFARYLPGDSRLRLLQRRRELLAERAHNDAAALADTKERLDEYGQSLMEHRIEMINQDVAWLNRLIETEMKRVRKDAADDTRSK